MLLQRTLPYAFMVIFIEDLPDASSTEGLKWTKLSVDIHFLLLAMKFLLTMK